MVSFLQALGAAAPNFMTGLEQGAEYSDKRKKSQREDAASKREDAAYNTDLKGKKVAADILSKYIGGGDQPAPQSPQMGPGQPSQPMQQQPQAMPMSAGGVNSGGMGSLIAQAAQKYGIPPDVGIAMGKQESGLNPNAPHGGLMQILDSTARQPGYGMQGVDPASLRDPRANADFGMHYLAARNPNVDWNDPAQRARALQSYNGGGDPNYVAHVTGRMGGGGAPQAPPQQQPQQAPDDIFRRYQEAQKAIWTNKDLGQDFQTQFAAAQHLDEQFKPQMAAAAQQAAVKHQQDMEKEAAEWHRQQSVDKNAATNAGVTKAQIGAEAGVTKAQIGAEAKVDTANIGAKARRDVADTAYKGKIDTANITATSRQEIAKTMREGRMDVAQMRSDTSKALAVITDTRARAQMQAKADDLVHKYEWEREKLDKLLAEKTEDRGVKQSEFYYKLEQQAQQHNDALAELQRHRIAMEQLGLLNSDRQHEDRVYGIDTRAQTASEGFASREGIAAQGLEAKERMASARNAVSEKLGLLKDTRLRDQFDQRTADKQRDYDLNREKFENAKTLGEKRQALAVVRASQTAITAAARNIVYGKGLGLDDNQIKDANAAAKNLVQSLNEDVAGMEAQIKSMTKGGGAEGGTPKTVKEDTAPLSAGTNAPPPDILAKAKKALDEGRDRETVLKRLQDAGYDTGGL